VEARIIIQGKKDRPQLASLKQPIIDLTQNNVITFCVIEGGMVSGEPSVIIASEDSDGSVVLQTSLDKFIMGATAMMGAAEHHWGWKQPEGHATLMPPDKEGRKMLLEAIKKELEEWDE
jgi:hypothetical protein